jgi:hypothetical protein
MDLEKISTGNELNVSKERILAEQEVGGRIKNAQILRPRAISYQKIKSKPVVITPVRVNPLEQQKIRKRFGLSHDLILLGMLAGSVIFGIPVGRLIANDVKENMFMREYNVKLVKYSDFNQDGVVDDREKSAFYKQVFPKSPQSVDDMLQGIRTYNPK